MDWRGEVAQPPCPANHTIRPDYWLAGAEPGAGVGVPNGLAGTT